MAFMTERDEVLFILRREAPVLKEQFGVTKIGLFGSVARNEAGEQSDIDLLIELDPDVVRYSKYCDLEDYLQSLFRRRVDIITTDGVSPHFKPYMYEDVVWV